ncbi:MAG TPA: hypothetical protein VHS31_11520, partial [Tepidisphaeraceae bacterium]|nr:hypothetical protein [Tepidisphaeraceae bacterium]
RPKLKKKDPLEKAPFSSLAQQRTVERQMQNLLVDLSEMARQMNAQIDTRAAKLEQLIKEADQRIALLGKQSGSSNGSHIEPPAMPAPAASAPEIPMPVDPRHAEVYSLADLGQDAKEIAARLNRPSGEVELILALRPRS